MGRGHAYRYDHFMLFDTDDFSFCTQYSDELDKCQNCTGYCEDGEFEFDDFAFLDFKNTVAKVFGFEMLKSTEYAGRESYYFAEDHRMKLGIDSGGGTPCLFVEPKEYSYLAGRGHNTLREGTYLIERTVREKFNKLCDEYPTLFSIPTSAWTSIHISRYSSVMTKPRMVK